MSVRERRCLRLGRLFGAIKRVQQCGHSGTGGRCGVDVNAPASKTMRGERRAGSCAIGVRRGVGACGCVAGAGSHGSLDPHC